MNTHNRTNRRSHTDSTILGNIRRQSQAQPASLSLNAMKELARALDGVLTHRRVSLAK